MFQANQWVPSDLPFLTGRWWQGSSTEDPGSVATPHRQGQAKPEIRQQGGPGGSRGQAPTPRLCRPTGGLQGSQRTARAGHSPPDSRTRRPTENFTFSWSEEVCHGDKVGLQNWQGEERRRWGAAVCLGHAWVSRDKTAGKVNKEFRHRTESEGIMGNSLLTFEDSQSKVVRRFAPKEAICLMSHVK